MSEVYVPITIVTFSGALFAFAMATSNAMSIAWLRSSAGLTAPSKVDPIHVAFAAISTVPHFFATTLFVLSSMTNFGSGNADTVFFFGMVTSW